MEKKQKINTRAAVFLIVMTVLSFANLIRIEIDGNLLKLAGLVVIIGVVAFFVTRGTNDSKDEGLDIRTCLSQMKNTIKTTVRMLDELSCDVVLTYKKKGSGITLRQIGI